MNEFLRKQYLRYIEAVNARDFDRMPEFVHETIEVNGRKITRHEYVGMMQELTDAVDDFVWGLEDLVIEDGRVAARLINTGTPTKEFLDVQPTGASVTFAELAFYHFRDGRIERVWMQSSPMSDGVL